MRNVRFRSLFTRQMLRRYGLQAMLVVIFLAVAVYYLADRKQSFSIYASTGSITVTTGTDLGNVWELPSSVLCLRLVVPAQAGDDLCDAFYKSHQVANASLVWPAGYTLAIHGDDEGQIVVEIMIPSGAAPMLYGDVELTEGSIIRFPRAALGQLGTLPLSGTVSIGQPAHPGASHLLRAGVYEIRENLGPFFRPIVVGNGEFRLGDYLWLTDRSGNPIAGDMFIAPSENQLADFDVVLTTPQQFSAINVQRVGGASTTVTTRWTDRLANDALPLAISALLTLFLNGLGILQSFTSTAERQSSLQDVRETGQIARSLRRLRHRGLL